MAIQGNTAHVAVAVDSRSQSEGLAYGCARSDGATLARFNRGDALVVVAVDESDLHVLDDRHEDALDGLLRLVLHVHVEANRFVVVEELAFKSQMQVELATRESEALRHHGARLLGARRQRGELHLIDRLISHALPRSFLEGFAHTFRMAIDTDERLWDLSSAFSPTYVMKSYSTPTGGPCLPGSSPSCRTIEAGAVVGSWNVNG